MTVVITVHEYPDKFSELEVQLLRSDLQWYLKPPFIVVELNSVNIYIYISGSYRCKRCL